MRSTSRVFESSLHRRLFDAGGPPALPGSLTKRIVLSPDVRRPSIRGISADNPARLGRGSGASSLDCGSQSSWRNRRRWVGFYRPGSGRHCEALIHPDFAPFAFGSLRAPPRWGSACGPGFARSPRSGQAEGRGQRSEIVTSASGGGSGSWRSWFGSPRSFRVPGQRASGLRRVFALLAGGPGSSRSLVAA